MIIDIPTISSALPSSTKYKNESRIMGMSETGNVFEAEIMLDNVTRISSFDERGDSCIKLSNPFIEFSAKLPLNSTI